VSFFLIFPSKSVEQVLAAIELVLDFCLLQAAAELVFEGKTKKKGT
jgi:hypothetical protein